MEHADREASERTMKVPLQIRSLCGSAGMPCFSLLQELYGLFGDYIGIMEKKMETTYHIRVYIRVRVPLK